MSKEERITIEVYPDCNHLFWRDYEVLGIMDDELIVELLKIKKKIKEKE